MLNQLDIRQRFEGRMLLFQVAMAILLLVLFIRPSGLMGRRSSDRV